MYEIFTRLFRGSKSELFTLLRKNLLEEHKTFLITANPEIFSLASKNKQIHDMLMDKRIIVSPDGEGIVKAARVLEFDIWGKIAGVDTVEYLFNLCSEFHKSLYLFGSSQDVLDNLEIILKTKYPNANIVGMKNGYDNKIDDIMEDIIAKQPDCICVALGVPKQEQAIYKYFDTFHKGIFIGVGGSLDVLSGVKKRAPSLLIKCKLEWAYRLMKEPVRIKKFYNSHVKFIYNVYKLKKRVKKT